jgi:protein-L-isoaspartate(D-aspartate) O-methyltransferase
VTVVAGPLTQGWQGGAPYDVIFLNGATEIVPHALTRQLKAGGRLVAVVARAPTGQAMLYRAVGGEVSGWPIFDAAAPLLPGFAAPPAFVF